MSVRAALEVDTLTIRIPMRLQRRGGRGRIPVAGEVPSPISPPSGCDFHPRCPFANQRCRTETPIPIAAGPSQVRCHAVQEGRLDKKTVRGALVQQSYPAPGD